MPAQPFPEVNVALAQRHLEEFRRKGHDGNLRPDLLARTPELYGKRPSLERKLAVLHAALRHATTHPAQQTRSFSRLAPWLKTMVRGIRGYGDGTPGQKLERMLEHNDALFKE